MPDKIPTPEEMARRLGLPELVTWKGEENDGEWDSYHVGVKELTDWRDAIRREQREDAMRAQQCVMRAIGWLTTPPHHAYYTAIGRELVKAAALLNEED